MNVCAVKSDLIREISSSSADQLNNRWSEYLDGELVPTGQLDDRFYSWLAGLGYLEDSLNERWKSLYQAGLPI